MMQPPRYQVASFTADDGSRYHAVYDSFNTPARRRVPLRPNEAPSAPSESLNDAMYNPMALNEIATLLNQANDEVWIERINIEGRPRHGFDYGGRRVSVRYRIGLKADSLEFNVPAPLMDVWLSRDESRDELVKFTARKLSSHVLKQISEKFEQRIRDALGDGVRA